MEKVYGITWPTELTEGEFGYIKANETAELGFGKAHGHGYGYSHVVPWGMSDYLLP